MVGNGSLESAVVQRAPAGRFRLALGAAAAAALAIIALYAATAVSMYELWLRVHTFDHAFLILPVCLYLIWERRDRLAAAMTAPSLVGLLLLAGFGVMWLTADTVDVAVGRQAALIGLVESAVLAILGWRAFAAILFPMAFLWFVLPTDLGLLPPLQRLATIVASAGIRLLDVPVFVEDVFIELPNARFWVAPGCAGLNFLLSGIALSLLFAEQMYTSWVKRIVCVLIAIAIALVANILRIIGLITASYFLNDVYDINDHYLEGWLFFAFVMFVMMWVGWRFRDPLPEPALPPASGSGGRAGAGRIAAMFAVAVAVAGLFPAYAAYRAGTIPEDPGTVTLTFPESVGAWQRVSEPSDWTPEFVAPDAQRTVRYADGSRWIDLYVAYYAYQGQGREVAAFTNRVYDDRNWQWLRSGGVDAAIGRADSRMTTELLRHGPDRRIVWYAYWVDGRYTGSPVVAKLLQAKAEMLAGDRRAGFLAIAADEGMDADAMRSFLSAMPPFPSLVGAAAAR